MNKRNTIIIVAIFSIMFIGFVTADILGVSIKPTITPDDNEIILDYTETISSDAQERIDKAIAKEVQQMQRDVEDAEYYNSEEFTKQELKIELINLCEKLVNEGKGDEAKTELNKLLNEGLIARK